MKYVIRLALVAIIGYLAYSLKESIMEPVRFKRVKKFRYAAVINHMEDIRNSQLAFKEVNRRYSGSFDELIPFLDTAQFTITQRRDTTVIEYDKVYRENVKIEKTLIDTLGYASIRDSLFASDYDLNNLRYIPETDKQVFEMKNGVVKKVGTTIPVLEVIARKEVVLHGQNERLIKNTSKDLILGSLTEAHLNGNW
jgi:hypothetical protein